MAVEDRGTTQGTIQTELQVIAEWMRKAQREVEAFHHFRELSGELLEVNEKICRARPVEDSLTPEEKKRRTRSSRKSLKK